MEATTALASNAVVRLRASWSEGYAAWRKRPLGACRYASIWTDGIYPRVGAEEDKAALLWVVGAREVGQKELLALELGYRESRESRAGVLRDLRDRGMAPLLAIGMVRWDYGRPWTRSSLPWSISAAGTIGP